MHHRQHSSILRQRGGLLCCLSFMVGLSLLPPDARAQAPAPNTAVYAQLAVRCLAEAPGTAQAFVLTPPAQMPYLRPALTGRWQADGRRLYLTTPAPADTAAVDAALPRLAFDVEEAGVRYERDGRRRFRRVVTLALHHTLTAADGRLLAEDRCRETHTDAVPRRARAALETPAFPETVGALPEGGFVRRVLEPAVLLGATALGVFLFFTLRSERTDA